MTTSQKSKIFKRHVTGGIIFATFVLMASLTWASSGQFTFGVSQNFAAGPEISSTTAGQIQQIRDLTAQSVVALKSESPDGGVPSETLQTNLVQRQSLLLALARQNPSQAWPLMLSGDARGKFPAALQQFVEQQTTISGKIEAWHFDDFKDPRKSKMQYMISRSGVKNELLLAGRIPRIPSGTVVQAVGYQLSPTTVLMSASDPTFPGNLAAPLATPTGEALGDQHTLIVLIKFTDTPTPLPFTKDQAYNLAFNGQSQAFYKEASYNQTSLSGTSIGWYTLPRTAAVNGVCQWPQFAGDGAGDEVYQLIKNDIDVKLYSRIVMLASHPCLGGGNSTIGKIDLTFSGVPHPMSVANVEAQNTYANPINTEFGPHPFSWTTFDSVFSHEMGHGLGSYHANGWECGAALPSATGPTCAHEEYNNHFDVMGRGFYALHFNAYFKILMGWLAPSSYVDIHTSGQYNLGPLEVSSGIRGARVFSPTDPNTPRYYLEFRRGLGFDAKLAQTALADNQNGLMVNWVPTDNVYFGSRLFDFSPTDYSTTDWAHVALRPAPTNDPHGILNDTEFGIQIGPVINTTATNATFNVTMSNAQCIRRDPIITLEGGVGPGHDAQITPGGSDTITFSVFNADSIGCSASTFHFTNTPPTGWGTTSMPDLVVPAQSTSMPSSTFTVTAPWSAANGTYPVFVRATNVATTKFAEQQIPFIVTGASATPVVQVTTPATGITGKPISIQWNYISGATHNNDWVTLVPKSQTYSNTPAAQRTWAWWNGLQGAAPTALPPRAGSLSLLPPTGIKEVQAVWYQNVVINGQYVELGRSPIITINQPQPIVFTVPSSAVAGQPVTASWTVSGTTNRLDWLGLVPTGTVWKSGQPWSYTNGSKTAPAVAPPKTGTVTFTVPNGMASVQFVYYLNNGYTELGRSQAILVTLPPR